MDGNFSCLVGRLADPVIYTPATETSSSRAVGRLVVNRPPRRGGEASGYDAIPIVAWGTYADNMAKYTSKGKELTIRGSIRTRAVPPRNGEGWKNYFEVQVEYVSFGMDSNREKLAKAMSGAPSNGVQQAQGVPPQGMPLQGAPTKQQMDNFTQYLQANPQLVAQLEAIAAGAVPGNNTQGAPPQQQSQEASELPAGETDDPFTI